MFKLTTELSENQELLVRKTGFHVNGTSNVAVPIYGNNERHCIECCRMRRPEFYVLRDGSLYAVSVSGDIYYLPPNDNGSDSMTLLYNAKRYFSWRLSTTDAPRLVEFISSCGAGGGDVTVTKRYRDVLSSVSTDPSNPFMDESYFQFGTTQETYGDGGWSFGMLDGYYYDPVNVYTADVFNVQKVAATTTPAITPLQDTLIGFQTDYDRCVIFRDGQLVYEGDYDGRAFPLMFNYKDRDIFTKDNCWVESHQVHTPQLDKKGKLIFRLFDDTIPHKPDANGHPQPVKYLGADGQPLDWSAKVAECMEKHYANMVVEPYDLKDDEHTENTAEYHSPVPLLSERSESVYLFGGQWERQFCDDGSGGKKPAAIDDEGKCGYASAVWTRGAYMKYNHYVMPFNDPEKQDRYGKVLETDPDILESSGSANKLFNDPKYDDDYPLMPRNAVPNKDCGTTGQDPPPEKPIPPMCEEVDLFKGEECYWGYPVRKGDNFKYSAADKIQGFRLIPCGNYSKIILNNPAVNISKWQRLVETVSNTDKLPQRLPKDWTLAKEFGKESDKEIGNVPVDDFGFPMWWKKYIESYYIYGAGKKSSWQYKTLKRYNSGESKADTAWNKHVSDFNSANDCGMTCPKPPKWEDVFDTESIRQNPMQDGDYEVKFHYGEEDTEQIILFRIENGQVVRLVINGVIIEQNDEGDWVGEQTEYGITFDLRQYKNDSSIFFDGKLTVQEDDEETVEYRIMEIPFPDTELVPRWWVKSTKDFIWAVKGDGSGTDDNGKAIQYRFNEPVTEQIKKHCLIKTAQWNTNYDAYAEPPVCSDYKDKNDGYGILRYDVFRVGTSDNDYDNEWYWFDGIQWNKGNGSLGDLLNSEQGITYLLLHKDDDAVSNCKERRLITAATPIQCCNDFLLVGLGTQSPDRQVYHKWDTIKRSRLDEGHIQAGKENFVCCDTWFAFTMQTGDDTFHSRFYAFADEDALPVLVWSADTNAEEAVQWGSCAAKCRYVFGRQTDKKGKLFYSTKTKGSWSFVHDYHILNENSISPEAGCRSNGSLCKMPCEEAGGTGEETFAAGQLTSGCSSSADEQLYDVPVAGSGIDACSQYTLQGTVQIKKSVSKGVVELDASGIPYFNEIDDPTPLIYPFGIDEIIISEGHSATGIGNVTFTNCPNAPDTATGMTCSDYRQYSNGDYVSGGAGTASKSASIWTAYDFMVNPVTNQSEYVAGQPDLHIELGYKALVVVQLSEKNSPSDESVSHTFKCYSVPDCRLRGTVSLTTQEQSGGVSACMSISCTQQCTVQAKGASVGTHSESGERDNIGGHSMDNTKKEHIMFQTFPAPAPNNAGDSPEKDITAFAVVFHEVDHVTDSGLGATTVNNYDAYTPVSGWYTVDPFTGGFTGVTGWRAAQTAQHSSSNTVNTIIKNVSIGTHCIGSSIWLGLNQFATHNEGSYCKPLPQKTVFDADYGDYGDGNGAGYVYQSALNFQTQTVGVIEREVRNCGGYGDCIGNPECPNGIYCANGVAFFDGSDTTGKVRVIIHPEDGAWTYTIGDVSDEDAMEALNCCGRYSVITIAGTAKLYYEDQFVKEVPVGTTVNGCCYKAGLIHFSDGHHEAYCEGEKLSDEGIWYGDFSDNTQAVDIICDKDYYIWTHKEVNVERQYVNPEYTGSNVVPDSIWQRYCPEGEDDCEIESAAGVINGLSGDWDVSIHSKSSGVEGAEPVQTMLLSEGYWRFLEMGGDAFDLAAAVKSTQEIKDWLLENRRNEAHGTLIDDTQIIAASFDGIITSGEQAEGDELDLIVDGTAGQDDPKKTITFLADRFKTAGLAKEKQTYDGNVSEFGQWEYIIHYTMIHTPMHEIANGFMLIKNSRSFKGIGSAFYRTNHLFQDKRIAQVKRYCEKDEDGRDIEETSLGTYYFFEDQYLTDLGDIIDSVSYGEADDNREWHTTITAVKECNQPNGNFGWNNRLSGEVPFNSLASLENVFKKSVNEDVLSWVKNTEYPHCGREMIRPVPYTKKIESNDKVTIISYDNNTFNEVSKFADKWRNGISKMRPMGVYVYNWTQCLSQNPKLDIFCKEFEDHTAGTEIDNTKYLTYNDRNAAVRWDRATAWERIINSRCGLGWDFKQYVDTLLADEPYVAAPITYQNGRLVVSGNGVLYVISIETGLNAFDIGTGRTITDETE